MRKIKMLDIVNGSYKPDMTKHPETLDINEVSQELGLECYIGWNEEFNKRVKGYPIYSWLCTDTQVGFYVYYMDDEPIIFSFQSARKSPETFEFVSKDAADKLRDFILSLKEEAEDYRVNYVNLEEEVDLDFQVNYKSQLLVDKGFYNGEEVEVMPGQWHIDYSTPSETWREIEVKKADGEVITINLSEFDIPANLYKVEADE